MPTAPPIVKFKDAPSAFKAVALHVLPVGPHRGRTLRRVAMDPHGVRYLDWLLGQDWTDPPTRRAVAAFLCSPPVADAIRFGPGRRRLVGLLRD